VNKYLAVDVASKEKSAMSLVQWPAELSVSRCNIVVAAELPEPFEGSLSLSTIQIIQNVTTIYSG
jgi:hypothetical protein